MQAPESRRLARRDMLRAIGALPLGWAVAPLFLGSCATQAGAAVRRLSMAPASQHFGSPVSGATGVWAFAGTTPGPLLRYRQGDTADIEVRNALPDATTVHWHGLRVPNAMDGVPHVTQPPIAPGERFRYRFSLPDAGTYWYHPHYRSFEQVTRGLYGAFVVEERHPPEVDEDWTWVLADWLLDAQGALRGDFGNLHDMSHAGRIGDVVTLNGRAAMHRDQDPEPLGLRAGSRVRLRLVNAASARIFALRFSGSDALVIATDGQPLEPTRVGEGSVLLGPGMRTDVLLDIPDGRVAITDRGGQRRAFVLRELVGSGGGKARPPFVALPPNPLPEPDIARARRHEIAIEGGAMGRLRSARVRGEEVPIQQLVRGHGMAWAMNGAAASDHVHEPLLTLARGESCVIALVNRTQWSHPMHLHGHTFRVLTVNGRPPRVPLWRDTLILDPEGSAEIAFVADNPGDWMFHCHILQHQQGGLMGSIRVA